MTSPSQNLNIKGRHGGFDVHVGGDKKQKINFAWPNKETTQQAEKIIVRKPRHSWAGYLVYRAIQCKQAAYTTILDKLGKGRQVYVRVAPPLT